MNLAADDDPDALWAEPEQRRGLLPSAAQHWAAAQGSEALLGVQNAFFDARHLERKKIGKPEVVEEVLTGAGFDGSTVTKELLSDRRWLDAARADHEVAVELGIFGVPTLLFPGTEPVFVRLLEITEGDRALEIFQRVKQMANDAMIHELKRATGGS